MVARCGCHDPIALGHGDSCDDELGPPRPSSHARPTSLRMPGPSAAPEWPHPIVARECNLSDYDGYCYTHGQFHLRGIDRARPAH